MAACVRRQGRNRTGRHLAGRLMCADAACRYMRVYNAAIKDRAFTYAIFFVFFCIHIIFCVWSAISPPLPFSNDWSHTGFICGIKVPHARGLAALVPPCHDQRHPTWLGRTMGAAPAGGA